MPEATLFAAASLDLLRLDRRLLGRLGQALAALAASGLRLASLSPWPPDSPTPLFYVLETHATRVRTPRPFTYSYTPRSTPHHARETSSLGELVALLLRLRRLLEQRGRLALRRLGDRLAAPQ